MTVLLVGTNENWYHATNLSPHNPTVTINSAQINCISNTVSYEL